MFLGDAAGPPSREITLERFGLAQTLERIAADISEQFVEPDQHGAIGLDPVLIVRPAVRREQQVQGSIRSCLAASPASACWMLSSRRAAFLGLLSRWTVSCQP